VALAHLVGFVLAVLLRVRQLVLALQLLVDHFVIGWVWLVGLVVELVKHVRVLAEEPPPGALRVRSLARRSPSF